MHIKHINSIQNSLYTHTHMYISIFKYMQACMRSSNELSKVPALICNYKSSTTNELCLLSVRCQQNGKSSSATHCCWPFSTSSQVGSSYQQASQLELSYMYICMYLSQLISHYACMPGESLI